MCKSPAKVLVNGQQTLVACRHCGLCRRNRVDDLVGRALAEGRSSSAYFAVTLTYRGDVPEAAILQYRDVQLMLKRLRADGYKVRYLVCGEYGSAKGRAHWHIVLFFRGKSPEVRPNSRVEWAYWPHGFSYFQEPDEGGIRYVVKYALKQEGNHGAVRGVMMSKKPPLGHAFFIGLADDIAERGFAVYSPEYSFSEVTRKGRAVRFWLRGRMRELFLDRYQIAWRLVWPDRPMPETEWFTEQYLDRVARDRYRAFEVPPDGDKPAVKPVDGDLLSSSPFTRILFVRDGLDTWCAMCLPLRELVVFKEGGAECRIDLANFAMTLESVGLQLSRAMIPGSVARPVLTWWKDV